MSWTANLMYQRKRKARGEKGEAAIAASPEKYPGRPLLSS